EVRPCLRQAFGATRCGRRSWRRWNLALVVPLAAGVVAGCAGARVPAGPGGPDAVCVVDAPLAGGVAGHSGDGSGGALASGGQSGREQGGRALRVEPAGGAGRGVAPIVVGLPGPADAGNAPVARTDAERLVYAQLYAPLVRLTCLGQVRGELAARWWAEEEGRRWDFELRRDAIYEGGDVATAADVARSWLRARPASVGGRGGGAERAAGGSDGAGGRRRVRGGAGCGRGFGGGRVAGGAGRVPGRVGRRVGRQGPEHRAGAEGRRLADRVAGRAGRWAERAGRGRGPARHGRPHGDRLRALDRAVRGGAAPLDPGVLPCGAGGCPR